MARKEPQKSPLQERRDEEKEERRRQILDAAEGVIAKHGWEATNFGEIAKHARLSRSLVYFYFPTRDALFHGICERGLEDLEARFREAIAAHKKGLDQVMAIGRAYQDFARRKPLYFELLSQFQAREFDPEAQTPEEEGAHNYGGACLQLVAQALGNGVADGSVRKNLGDLLLAAVTTWSFTHGLIQIASRKETMLKAKFDLTAKKVVDHGFEMLRSSLATA